MFRAKIKFLGEKLKNIIFTKEMVRTFATAIYEDIKPLINAHPEAYSAFIKSEQDEEKAILATEKQRNPRSHKHR
jgi:hypothetical protein